jgi:acyl-CoA oxidase
MTATTAADIEVGKLRHYLDGEYTEIRDRVRAALAEPGHEPADGLPRDEYRAQVSAWAKEVAGLGETAIGFPREFGGDNDIGRYVTGFETLGLGDLSLLVKLGVQFGLFGGAVHHLGTRRHHERYLPGIISLELPGCFAMTETAHGSNVQALETTATYDPQAQAFVVHTPHDGARKDYIGNAARDGRLAVVFAQLMVGGYSRGVHALLVPLRDAEGRLLPGVRIEDCGAKLGLEGVDNGRIWFDSVRVPREALLDRFGGVTAEGDYRSDIESATRRFFTMIGTLVQGRVSISGAAISAAKVALVIAVRHAAGRRQFGPPDGADEVPLLDYRTHQRRLLIPLAATYAYHFAQRRLVAELHDVFSREDFGRARRQLETLAAAVKAVTTWHATYAIQGCREACGGWGYLRGARFAALKADTDVFTTFEGDNTVLLQLAAKNLLTDYRDEFAGLNPLGMAAFYAGQAVETLAERTALRELLGRLADELLPGRDEDGDLLERETQLELFRWRQRHVLAGVARRLKRGIDADREPFEVFLDCQDHIVAAGRAWADLVVLEAFAAAVDHCDDRSLRPLLGRVCSLYALSRVEEERGWYQEHGRLSSVRSKSVIKAVNALCAELRPAAEPLVEAFGVPERQLGDAGQLAG